jgi:E3 ubiquitin-protein ligase DOA10
MYKKKKQKKKKKKQRSVACLPDSVPLIFDSLFLMQKEQQQQQKKKKKKKKEFEEKGWLFFSAMAGELFSFARLLRFCSMDLQARKEKKKKTEQDRARSEELGPCTMQKRFLDLHRDARKSSIVLRFTSSPIGLS